MINWFINLFCDKTFGAARSPEWRTIRKVFIDKHPECAVCEKKGKLLSPLEVHHVIPFHIDPRGELDPDNLVTLCPVHHLWVGHLGSFRSWNEDVKGDADYWLEKITGRP